MYIVVWNQFKLLQKITDMREEVMHTIFLELHKAYNALDTDRCMEILQVCGVEPHTCRILWTYWDILTVVARAGQYYGEAFKVFQGVTHGYPLSPTIFNVVLDALVRHWISLVV